MSTNTVRVAAGPSSLLRVYLQLIAVAIIWGGTFVAGRFLAADIAPLLLASLRFLIASLTLGAFLWFTDTPLVKPSIRQGLQLVFLAFFGIFLYNICFFYGLHYISASRASLIVALNPAAIALGSYALGKERLGVHSVLGILLCISGAGLVIISGNTSVLTGAANAWVGDGLILGCVLSWVLFSISSRGLSAALGPLHTVSYAIWLGSLMLSVAALSLSPSALGAMFRLSAPQLLSLLYLGALGSAVAYIWYYDAIQQIGPTRSGAFIALNPLTAVLLGWLLLGERLTPLIGLGGLLVMLGLYLGNRQSAGRARTS
jgi:drug/metabolite transporter (DMT)-like permease